MKKDSIRKIIKRGNIATYSRGNKSPLESIKTIIVTILIQMARIRQCLTPSCRISLVNSLISDSELSKDLVVWKKKHIKGKKNDVSKVGRGYWAGFMKRRGHEICSKKGESHELDYLAWTTYANFNDMYQPVYDDMDDAGIAVVREEPV